MNTKLRKWLAFLLAIVMLTGLSSGWNTAAASGAQPEIYNLNITLEGDASTQAYLNWHTERTASSKTEQPNMAVAYCQASAILDIQTAAIVNASQSIDDRVAYHKAALTNLTPETTYKYVILDLDAGSVTKEYTFTTASDSGDTFSFLALPDAYYRTTSSYNNYWGNTLRTATNTYPDAEFILHTGDFGSGTSRTYWDGFFSLDNGTLSEMPIIPATVSSSSSNRQHVLNFNVPASGDKTSDYSFVYENALFLVLNTKLTSTSDINDHISFIEKEIAAKGDGKWIVGIIGDSFYGRSSNSSTIKRKLSAAFESAGVSLVLQGGDNIYSRSYLIRGEEWLHEYTSDTIHSTNDGVIYLTPGNAGAEYSSSISSSAKWIHTAFTPSTSAERKAAEKKTYTNIEISSEAISVIAQTVDGEEIDRFEINREDRPDAEEKVLNHLALNNSFGNDPKTERSISWMSPTTLTRAFVELTDMETGEVTNIDGITEKVTSYFTGSSNGKNQNRVQISGLNPGTTYEYRIGNIYYSNQMELDFYYYSDRFTFTTEAEEMDSFTAIHVADSQGSSSQYEAYWGRLLNTAVSRHPDAAMIIHTGDMVDSVTYDHWNGFFTAAGSNLSSAAFLPVLGNHEGTSGEKFASSVFNVSSDNGYALNYSYIYGNALFINLNSNYTNAKDLQKQGEWITELAAEARASRGDDIFIIVSFHKAPYGGLHRNDQSAKDIKKYLVPYLEDIKADLVLQGHDHNFIRSYPIKNGEPNLSIDSDTINTAEAGPIFLVSRNSGEKSYGMTSKKTDMRFLWEHSEVRTNPDSTVYTVLTIEANQITVQGTLENGNIIDSFTIIREAAGTGIIGSTTGTEDSIPDSLYMSPAA